MKTKIKSNVRVLRRILGLTQGEFAATVGVSKDTVASWETGRNPVSASLARRMALVTGADERALANSELPLLTMNPNPQRQPYTMEAFKRHQKLFEGKTPEDNVRRRIGPCQDALALLFTAAVRYGSGAESGRLTGVLGSFSQWCRETAEYFELEPGIDAQLEERKRTEESTRSYGEWRALAKELPHTAKLWGFKDNPKKADQERLTLNMTTYPVWAPGWDMRAG